MDIEIGSLLERSDVFLTMSPWWKRGFLPEETTLLSSGVLLVTTLLLGWLAYVQVWRGSTSTPLTPSSTAAASQSSSLEKNHPLARPVSFFSYSPSQDWNHESYFYNTCLKSQRLQVQDLLLKLSGALQTIQESPYEWIQMDNRLQERYQERLHRLADIFHQDMVFLEQEILKPITLQPVLPLEPAFGSSRMDGDTNGPSSPQHKPPKDPESASYDTADQVVAHIVRDWTVEGAPLRRRLYDWCLDRLQQYHRHPNSSDTIRIIVPGAGLGRLAWDLAARLSFSERHQQQVVVEAVESSPGMAAGAAAILQRHVRGALHPYATDHLTNEVEAKQRYDSIAFPDVPQSNLALPDENRRLSFTVGDFVQLKHLSSYQSKWNAVVTCFFIDTATNLLDYIDTIRTLLAPGGLWINVGPLQWHRPSRIVVSSDELNELVQIAGFQVLEWSVDVTPIEYRSRNTVRSTHYDAYCPLRFVVRWNG